MLSVTEDKMCSLFVLDHKKELLNSWFSNQMERWTSLERDQGSICTQRISDNFCGCEAFWVRAQLQGLPAQCDGA